MKRKNLLIITIVMLMLIATGCDKEEKIEYGTEIGTVTGNVVMQDDKIDINLSNIKSYVGQEIDYLSGVDMKALETYDDFQVWVDASLVDVFTPGDYKAANTFEYDGKEYTKEIVVTIIEIDEQAGDSTNLVGDQNNNQNNNQSAGQTVGQNESQNNMQSNSSGETDTTIHNGNTGGNGETNNVTPTTSQSASGNGGQTPEITTSSGWTGTTTYWQGTTSQIVTTRPNNQTTTAGNSTTQTTTKRGNATTRPIVTTTGNRTTENQVVSYSSIELLSGKVVKIKNTTSKYIVATHTDISYITENGEVYKISKLIVTFNTGATQTLETVKERSE